MKPRPRRKSDVGLGSVLRSLLLLGLVFAVIAGLLWAARILCRLSPDCPWTVLY